MTISFEDWIDKFRLFVLNEGTDILSINDWYKVNVKEFNNSLTDTIFGFLHVFLSYDLMDMIKFDTFYELFWPMVENNFRYLSLFNSVLSIEMNKKNVFNQSIPPRSKWMVEKNKYEDIKELINYVNCYKFKLLTIFNDEIDLLTFLFDNIFKIMKLSHLSFEDIEYSFRSFLYFYDKSESNFSYFEVFASLPREFREDFKFIKNFISSLTCRAFNDENIRSVYDILNGTGLLNNSDFYLLNLMIPESNSNWNNIVINFRALKLDKRPEALLSNPKFLIDACCIYGSFFGWSSYIEDIMKERTPELYLEFEATKVSIKAILSDISKNYHIKAKKEALEAELLTIVHANGRALEWCDCYRNSEKFIEAASETSIWCASGFSMFFSNLNESLLMKLVSSDWRVGMWLNIYDRKNFRVMSKMIRFSPKIFEFDSIVRKTYCSIERFESMPTSLILHIISFTY